MADRSNITRARKRAISRTTPQTIMDQASVSASQFNLNVQIFTQTLANLMQKFHGGDWRVRIDHERRVVMIADNGRS